MGSAVVVRQSLVGGGNGGRSGGWIFVGAADLAGLAPAVGMARLGLAGGVMPTS